MKEKMLMPVEEWEDFRRGVLGLSPDPAQIRFFKMAFFGAMACTTDFFQKLLTQCTPDEAQVFYEQWRTGLQVEIDKYEGELTKALLEDADGSLN